MSGDEGQAVTDPSPQTRHYHGGVVHEHPGGDMPHDHPDPDGRPGHGVGADVGFVVALGCGIAAVIGGVLAVLAEAGDHAACGSGLVQAASSGACGTADTLWTAGVVGIVLGTVVLLGAVIVRSRL